ncbi:alpha/beta hydrolase family protein [Sphingomonas parapaucimobilis]|uniref:alpha/beta hydrolase family protein n=1 Tax=Sphingomonas parapaucimobilis TaxID=28213 RepID=UPI0035C80BA4
MGRSRHLAGVLLTSLVLSLPGAALATLPASDNANVRVEQAHIPSAPGVVLAGELHLPAQSSQRPPIVLLLGGGGASPHGIYPLLEAQLNSEGIATFSFDKRGVGQSTGIFQDAIDVARQDARAALLYLRSRSDVIDTARIAILGLSQGAVIAPALAVENPPVVALVLLAAPAGQRGQMFLDGMRAKLTASGMGAKAAERVVEATRLYLDALMGGRSANTIAARRDAVVRSFVAANWRADLADGAVKTLSEPATSSLYTVAANANLAQVKVPVLAIYAANDTTVSTALSMPEARRALAKNHDAMIVEMPDVEHGFKPLVTTPSGKKDYAGWPISDPATLRVIDDWLRQRLLRAGERP